MRCSRCLSNPSCVPDVRETNKQRRVKAHSVIWISDSTQIDLTDMPHKPDGDYNYIAHYTDHWSKYHVLWPFKRKTADEDVNGLNERVSVFRSRLICLCLAHMPFFVLSFCVSFEPNRYDIHIKPNKCKC